MLKRCTGVKKGVKELFVPLTHSHGSSASMAQRDMEEMQWVERLCSGMGAAAINLANSRLLDRFCTDDIVLG